MVFICIIDTRMRFLCCRTIICADEDHTSSITEILREIFWDEQVYTPNDGLCGQSEAVATNTGMYHSVNATNVTRMDSADECPSNWGVSVILQAASDFGPWRTSLITAAVPRFRCSE